MHLTVEQCTYNRHQTNIIPKNTFLNSGDLKLIYPQKLNINYWPIYTYLYVKLKSIKLVLILSSILFIVNHCLSLCKHFYISCLIDTLSYVLAVWLHSEARWSHGKQKDPFYVTILSDEIMTTFSPTKYSLQHGRLINIKNYNNICYNT